MLAYVAAIAALAALPIVPGSHFRIDLASGCRFIPAVAVMFLVGLVDDIRGLSAWQKLAGQLLASALAIAAGLRITSLVGHEAPAIVSVIVTLIWLVGCSNAFNLIDGVDGLAAGAGLFAAATMLIAGMLQGNIALVYATAPLVGALLGFLRFNFNPATIFLGDSGSLVVGFALGCLGINWSQKSATALGLTAPLMALAIPLLDTALAIVRRFITKQPIFAADRGHIHHRLLDRGLTPRRVALSLYAACGLAAALSLLTSVSENYMAGLVVVVFCAFTWLGVQHLGYIEFGMAGRLILDGSFRRLLHSQMELRRFDSAIASAETPLECWNVIRKTAINLGFFGATVTLDDQCFEELSTSPERQWSVRIGLGGRDFVELLRAAGEEGGNAAAVAPFANALQRSLSARKWVFSTPVFQLGTTSARSTFGGLQRPASVGK